jgi:hypothetical protein
MSSNLYTPEQSFTFDEASRSGNYGYYRYGYYQQEAYKSKNWETDYEVTCRKFEEYGYGNCVPEIVFWNLRDSRSTPVMKNQKGVALVSVYSKNLIKLFLEESGEMNPEMVMEAAISFYNESCSRLSLRIHSQILECALLLNTGKSQT